MTALLTHPQWPVPVVVKRSGRARRLSLKVDPAQRVATLVLPNRVPQSVALAFIIGALVILWLTFPSIIPEKYSALRSTLNTNMTIVIGTLVILLIGIILTKIKENNRQRAVA